MEASAGPFEILEVLGEGSFGTVCVARVRADPLGRRVALKILKGAYTTNRKILNRTRDEARLLSKINHPNIVRVEKLMQVRDRPVVVMEHVEGVSLDKLLIRFREGIPASVGLDIARLTCLALHVAYAEAKGDDGRPMRVIHRDIKPSNILLSVHGEVKVVDFGIAKGDFEGREAETESVVMGSRPYMAPERLDGVDDSPLVDVFSAGMSLFELLTGQTMQLSINPLYHERYMNKQLDRVRVPGMEKDALDDLRELLRTMCAYTRDYRPSAVEVSRELERLVHTIDSEHRVTLQEFARTTVRPLYESRELILPVDAVNQLEDEAFLREVTGTIGTPASKTARSRAWKRAPVVFMGSLSTLFVVLGILAAWKFASEQIAGSEDLVQVLVRVPNGTEGQLDGWRVRAIPGGQIVQLPAGLIGLNIHENGGGRYVCPLWVEAGAVFEYRAGELLVAGGATQPCNPLDRAR